MRLNLILILAALAALPHARSAEVYVAPDGSDANAGTKERPLASLEVARDRVRGQGGTVWIRGGLYRREKTLELTAADSGVVYRAFGGETPRVIAGRVVKPAEFKPVTDVAVLARLDPAARGKVVQADLAALGVRHAGPFPDLFRDGGGILELFFDNRRMPLSRWPNEGYTRMVKVIDNGEWSGGPNRRGGTFIYEGDRPLRWKAALAEGLWLDGFWRVPWQPEKIRVKSIDFDKRTITHAEPAGGGIGSKYKRPEGDGKEPWYALNLLEEIDRPGEWSLNFKTKTLYFWPPAALSGGDILITDMATPIIRVTGASNVRIQGLLLEGGLGNGVEIRGGEGNLAAGCTLRNLGMTGIVIAGGKNNGASGCDLYALGHGGIYITGGDRKTLTPSGNYAVNNHIHHFGQVQKTYAPGIRAGYGGGECVGLRLAHNLIHDAPHAAVLYGGNDNIIEYNEVHNIALDSGDVGAFYTVLDWASRGNMVRYNFVHHSTGANAFYMDDGDSGDTIFGNVVYRTGYGPFIGGGHDNMVRNNLIVEAKRGIHMDARGVARGYNAQNMQRVNALKTLNFRQPPWSGRFPELVKILEFHPDLPTGNVVENNVLAGCPEPFHLEKGDTLRFSTIKNNLELPNAGVDFVDAANLDFRLKPDSTVLRKLPAFQLIPFEKIGLYLDEYRKRLPTAKETGRYGDRRLGEGFDSDIDRKASDRAR